MAGAHQLISYLVDLVGDNRKLVAEAVDARNLARLDPFDAERGTVHGAVLAATPESRAAAAWLAEAVAARVLLHVLTALEQQIDLSDDAVGAASAVALVLRSGDRDVEMAGAVEEFRERFERLLRESR